MRPSFGSLEDLNSLLELENICFSFKDSPLSRRALRYHLVRERILCLKEDGVLLGYILIFPRTIHRIYSLCVHPKARGRGLAKMLINSAEKEFKTSTFRLEVRIDNKTAIAFYEALGFKHKTIKANFYPDGCDALVIIKH